MTTNSSRETEKQGRLLSILKTGSTIYGNSWCTVAIELEGGHTDKALAAGESFPLDQLPHWHGLSLKLQIREDGQLRVAPVSAQSPEARQEAEARQRGEKTATPSPVTQDQPTDSMIEFKLHQQEENIQMVNDQHWRLADRQMRHQNDTDATKVEVEDLKVRVNFLEAAVSVDEEGNFCIDCGTF